MKTSNFLGVASILAHVENERFLKISVHAKGLTPPEILPRSCVGLKRLHYLFKFITRATFPKDSRKVKFIFDIPYGVKFDHLVCFRSQEEYVLDQFKALILRSLRKLNIGPILVVTDYSLYLNPFDSLLESLFRTFRINLIQMAVSKKQIKSFLANLKNETTVNLEEKVFDMGNDQYNHLVLCIAKQLPVKYIFWDITAPKSLRSLVLEKTCFGFTAVTHFCFTDKIKADMQSQSSLVLDQLLDR